jgi:CHRD domain
MQRLYPLIVGLLAALAMTATGSAESLNRTFAVPLTSAEEVPLCGATDAGDRGVALFKIVDLAAGTVEFKVIATNLPGDVAAAHIHGPAPVGGTAGVVQPLPVTGSQVGVVAAGTFTNPGLVAAALTNPELYYVNVHTTTCPDGAIRGQLG